MNSHKFDLESDIRKIPIPNLINKHCDLHAEEAYRSAPNPSIQSPILPSTDIYKKIGTTIYIDDVKRKLRFASRDNDLKEYIIEKVN